MSGAAALTELGVRVRHWPTRCTAAGGPVYQTTAALQLRGLAYRPASSGGWQLGVVAYRRSAGGWHSVRSDRYLQGCGVLACRYCACAGVCCQRPCLVHPARVACLLGQVPAGTWCLGSPVLRPHRRVLPAAVYGPPSKGGHVRSTRRSGGRFAPPSRTELDLRHAAIRQALWTYARECPWSCPESCLWACQVSVSSFGYSNVQTQR